MKFGQLIEYNMRNIFFQKYAENKDRRLVPMYFDSPRLGHTVKATV